MILMAPIDAIKCSIE